jgi:hypothetical protein
MIRCWLESDDKDFGGGEYVLAALPVLGTKIRARDSQGGKHSLIVRSIEMESFRGEDWPAAQKIGGYPDVIVYCSR